MSDTKSRLQPSESLETHINMFSSQFKLRSMESLSVMTIKFQDS